MRRWLSEWGSLLVVVGLGAGVCGGIIALAVWEANPPCSADLVAAPNTPCGNYEVHARKLVIRDHVPLCVCVD